MPALTPLFMDTPAGQPDLPVTARDLRTLADALQPGVLGAAHLKATPGAGLALTVQPGVAYVPDGQASPSLYRCEWSGSAATVPISAADGSSPRVDQLVARVRDLNVDGGSQRSWVLEVVAGVPASGATFDNRTGAAPLPPRAIRLADVVVPAGASSIGAGNVRDRRPWARGASLAVLATGTSISNGSAATIGGSAKRLELSGAPIVVEITFIVAGQSAPNCEGSVQLLMDGALQFNGGVVPCPRATVPYGGATSGFLFAPGAGSHVFSLSAFANLGDIQTLGGVNATRYTVRELPAHGLDGNA